MLAGGDVPEASQALDGWLAHVLIFFDFVLHRDVPTLGASSRG